MLLKRSISLFLAMILITQPITILGSENANSSDVLLSVDAQVFSAVVPTQLPVWMSASGVITVAEDVNITNTSKGPIRIDDIELANVKANWELVNFDSDFSSFKVGAKKLAMSFNGDKSLASGSIPLGLSNLTPIDGLGSMHLNYDAKIPAQSTGLVDEIPANVVFTLKWHEVGSADIEESVPSAYEFVPADTKILTINFKGVTADDDTVVWSSSNETVATVTDHVSRGRSRPIDGSKQCMVTAVSSGKATITGVLGDGTANSFEVVVADKGVVSIDVTKAPNKIAYIEGENFNPAGMIVTVNYNNGTSMDISDYVIADGNNLIIGQDSVTVNYNGKLTSQAITVVAKTLTSIVITTPPTKTNYLEGNDFDATGMIVTAYYDNGTNKVVVTNYSIVDGTNLMTGKTSVTISYNGKTTTQAIRVNDIVVGTKYVEGNYEYSYGQGINYFGKWETASGQKGWGVRVIDNTQTDYTSPLTMIQGHPVTNMTNLFYKNPATTLNLIDWDNSNVTDMQGMFANNKATNLDLRDFNTSNVTNMRAMFSGNQVSGLDVSSFDTSNVTNMREMFANSQARNLGLSRFNTSNVTTMSGMFSGSQAISLNLSSFDTSNVTDMNRMFSVSKATSLDLSSFDTSKVTNMGYMFGSSWADNLDLSSFNTSNVTDMNDMFENSKATSLDLSSFDTSKVVTIDNMFKLSKVKNLKARTQADADKYKASSEFPTGVNVTVKS